METLLNARDDLQWLFDAHLKNFLEVQKRTKSATIKGNEDSPTVITCYPRKNPLITDTPVAKFEVDDNGDLKQVSIEKIPVPTMRETYSRIHRTQPLKTLLLFRLGDYYEMFFEDAKEAASDLNMVVTERNQIPMCGIPLHSAEKYIRVLLEAGWKIAICQQVGEPKPGKVVPWQVFNFNLSPKNANVEYV